MRTIPAALTTLALAMLTLTGCSVAQTTASAATCDALAPTGPALSVMEVDGAPGETPTVTMPAAVNVPSLERTEVVAGDGRQLTDTTQVISAKWSFVSSASGTVIGGSDYSQPAQQLPIANLGGALIDLPQQLLCARVGSRVAIAVPVTSLDASQVAGLGLTDTQGVIAIVDILGADLPKAEGSDVFNATPGMPAVVRASDGRPGIIVPDAAAPDTTQTQTLIRGEGAAITADDAVIVQYTGVGWDDKKVFDSTWEAGSPTALSLASSAPPGFAQALVGATIGSQVLIVVPASEVPTDGSSVYPSGQALVYVVDVLGTIATS